MSTFNFSEYTRGQFFVIAGPCVIESENITLQIARFLKELSLETGIPIIFKASYQKANRTSLSSFTGMAVNEALEILAKVKVQTGLPVLTDIHLPSDATMVAPFVDVLQIPAFLCRQTDLILAAVETGKVVNIKKGQFASADIMKYAVDKAKSTGNQQILLTERGNFFGYEDLVVDMRNIVWMKENGIPVVYDATHSVQQPGKANGSSGGLKSMVTPLAKAAIVSGADGVFLETHPNPETALSDASTMLNFYQASILIKECKSLYDFLKNN